MLEKDKNIRIALQKAVRRHYRTLELDRSSFFNFVTATIDPDYVDIEDGLQNLREIPTDRRLWPSNRRRVRPAHRSVWRPATSVGVTGR